MDVCHGFRNLVLADIFAECYQKAVRGTVNETNLPKETFPVDCPFSQEQVLNWDYWLFGLCDAMDGGYKGWNPYIERHLAIFVNSFRSRAN